MKINITIVRSQETAGSEEAKKAQQILKSLIATEFPVGVLHTHDADTTRTLHFSGTVEDFVKAIAIKKEFLSGSQASDDKHDMTEKLRPIYEKSKERMTS